MISLTSFTRLSLARGGAQKLQIVDDQQVQAHGAASLRARAATWLIGRAGCRR